VAEGITGLLADNDAGAWIAALEALLDSPSVRDAVAKAAFHDVSQHRDLKVSGRRFAELVPAGYAYESGR